MTNDEWRGPRKGSARRYATNCLGLRREAKRHAAFVRTKAVIGSFGPRAGESGVAAALRHRSPRSPQNVSKFGLSTAKAQRSKGAKQSGQIIE